MTTTSTTPPTTAPTVQQTAPSAQPHGTASLRLTPRIWTDVAVVFALAIIAMIGFGTAFNSITYLIAGTGGLVVGAAAAILSYRLRFGVLLTLATGFVAYFLFGTALVVPAQGIGRVLPSLESLASLTIGAVNGWRDILTLRAPVSLPDYVTAVPYVCGWVVALVSVTLAIRWLPRKRRTPARSSVLLIGPVLLYLAGVLLGTEQPYFAGARGVAFAALALVWLGWRRRDGAALAVAAGGSLLRRKLVGTAVIVVVAVAAGIVVGGVIAPPSQDRFVLRDTVEPPFEPLTYPSPLAGFRNYTNKLSDTTLFTVDGLKQGQLLRIAAMDTYNGEIWGVAGSEQATDGSGAFRLVGSNIPQPSLLTKSATSTLKVTVDGYNDVWIPDTGYATALDFTDSVNRSKLANVRYNYATGTAVLTSGLKDGATFDVSADVQKVPEDGALKKVPVAGFAPGSVTDIPDAVVAKATEITSHSATPIEKLRALQQYLSTKGFFSHGTEAQQAASRAGHGADRMYDMVTLPNMVGDQEQYSSLFALMARSFGYPTRVVMGFAPQVADGTTGAVKVTGADVTAWDEVAFEGVGWVPFFPTPKNPDVPQSQVPKPQSEPQPQVRQPPRTDSEQDDLVTATQINKSDDDKKPFLGIPAWVYTVLLILAIPAAIIFVPILIIALIKRRRMRQRRQAAALDRAAGGAWDEMLDRLSELGYAVPTRLTRTHVADGLERQLPAQDAAERPQVRELALLTDEAVFSGRDVAPEQADRAWTEAMAVVAAAHATVGWARRLLSRYRLSTVRAWFAKIVASATSDSSK